MTHYSPEQTRHMANAIRALSMDAVQKANSGHPGLPMGAADIATVLFTQFLKFDASDPHWADRDRFILSAGHGSMLNYSLLHLMGYDLSVSSLVGWLRQHTDGSSTVAARQHCGSTAAPVAAAAGVVLQYSPQLLPPL